MYILSRIPCLLKPFEMQGERNMAILLNFATN